MCRMKYEIQRMLSPDNIPDWIASARASNREPRTLNWGADMSLPQIRLIKNYWKFLFPSYPLVDRSQLEMEYDRLSTGKGDCLYDRNILICIFSIIGALSCQSADFIPAQDRRSSAESHFKKARRILQLESFNTSSPEKVQCLLLMAQYLESSDSVSCCILAALAIREAVILGFHLPEDPFRPRSLQEQRQANIIWHGCTFMDQLVNIYLFFYWV